MSRSAIRAAASSERRSPEEQKVTREAVDQVGRLVGIPEPPDPALLRHDAEVAVGLLGGDRLRHGAVLEIKHPLVAGVLGHVDEAVDEHAQADEAAAAVAAAKRCQKIPIDVKLEQVALNRGGNAAADLAPNPRRAWLERHEPVGRGGARRQDRQGDRRDRDAGGEGPA